MSHGEATGSISFNFWKNEKCLCHSGRNAGVTVCEAVPWTDDGLCLVWSLKAEPWQDMEAGGTVKESLRAEERVRGAGVYEQGLLGLVGLAGLCTGWGREPRHLFPITRALAHHQLA